MRLSSISACGLALVLSCALLHDAGAATDDQANPGMFSVEPGILRSGDAPPAPRDMSGNPLWGIPLRVLTVTRERPIFSPSRRPPPPAVAGVPEVAPPRPRVPPPAAPERPTLSLVGTVLSENEGIGVFVDQATKNVVRLKTGENHSGWILKTVRGREATLQKSSETVILALPPPAGSPNEPLAAPGLPAAPIPSPGQAPPAGAAARPPAPFVGPAFPEQPVPPLGPGRARPGASP